MKKFVLLLAFISLSFTACAPRVVAPAPATKVVVVKKVPEQHKVVVIKGKRYYRWNGKYHRKTRRGYVVVKL